MQRFAYPGDPLSPGQSPTAQQRFRVSVDPANQSTPYLVVDSDLLTADGFGFIVRTFNTPTAAQQLASFLNASRPSRGTDELRQVLYPVANAPNPSIGGGGLGGATASVTVGTF
jgi:hypothetical protein